MKTGTATVPRRKSSAKRSAPTPRPRLEARWASSLTLDELASRLSRLDPLDGSEDRLRQRTLRPPARRPPALSPRRARLSGPPPRRGGQRRRLGRGAQGRGPPDRARRRARGAPRGARAGRLRRHLLRRDTPPPLLARLQPDVHCKGPDYGPPRRRPGIRDRAPLGGATALVGDPKDHAQRSRELIARVKALPGSEGSGNADSERSLFSKSAPPALMREILPGARTSSLGDIVHCLPALRALRRPLPPGAASAGWWRTCSRRSSSATPDLDEVLTVGLRRWRRLAVLESEDSPRELSREACAGSSAFESRRRPRPHGQPQGRGPRRSHRVRPAHRHRAAAGRREQLERGLALRRSGVVARSGHAVDRAPGAGRGGARARPAGSSGSEPQDQLLAAAGGSTHPPGRVRRDRHPPRRRLAEQALSPRASGARVAASRPPRGTGRRVLVSAGPGEERPGGGRSERASAGAATPAEASDLPRFGGAPRRVGRGSRRRHRAPCTSRTRWAGRPSFFHGPTDPDAHDLRRAGARAPTGSPFRRHAMRGGAEVAGAALPAQGRRRRERWWSSAPSIWCRTELGCGRSSTP